MNLLDIRLRHSKQARAAELGIQPHEVVDANLVDYLLPGSAVGDCHKELMDQLMPALHAYYEHKVALGDAKNKFNPHAACISHLQSTSSVLFLKFVFLTGESKAW